MNQTLVFTFSSCSQEKDPMQLNYFSKLMAVGSSIKYYENDI